MPEIETVWCKQQQQQHQQASNRVLKPEGDSTCGSSSPQLAASNLIRVNCSLFLFSSISMYLSFCIRALLADRRATCSLHACYAEPVHDALAYIAVDIVLNNYASS